MIVASDDDYCELCELPLSQCVHGRPAPVPPEPEPRSASAPKTRVPRAAARVPGSPLTPTVRTSTAPRRWTAPEEFRPVILATLDEAGGRLDADEVFDRLEERLGDRLRPGDRESNPQGELRWRAAARRARKALIDDGLLVGAPGAWELTEAGSDAASPLA